MTSGISSGLLPVKEGRIDREVPLRLEVLLVLIEWVLVGTEQALVLEPALPGLEVA